MAGRPEHKEDSRLLDQRTSYGELLKSKAIFPTKEEVIENPRSRSARLRVIKKLRNPQLWVMSNRTIVIVLIIITVFGAGSIGLVWMRMEISAVAKECGELEDELEIVARKCMSYGLNILGNEAFTCFYGQRETENAQGTVNISC